jgi:hypothetical protein
MSSMPPSASPHHEPLAHTVQLTSPSPFANRSSGNLFYAVCLDADKIAVLKDLNWESDYAPEVVRAVNVMTFAYIILGLVMNAFMLAILCNQYSAVVKMAFGDTPTLAEEVQDFLQGLYRQFAVTVRARVWTQGRRA